MASSDPYAAEVQPLRAGATAGYLEAFRAAMGQTAATSSPAQPATADEHRALVVPAAAAPTDVPAGECRKCGVPFSHRGCHEGGPYCEYCVTQCRARRGTLHLCMICR